jgi:hypothetical protein
MTQGALLLYAYFVGTAFTACAGSFIEWRTNSQARLRTPFVTHEHILRSLALVLAAGPYFLRAELRAAHQASAISAGAALTGLVFSTIWALASGIVLVEFIALCARLF